MKSSGQGFGFNAAVFRATNNADEKLVRCLKLISELLKPPIKTNFIFVGPVISNTALAQAKKFGLNENLIHSLSSNQIQADLVLTLDLLQEARDFAKDQGLPWVAGTTNHTDNELRKGGLLSEEKSPETIAQLVALLLMEPNLRLSLRNEMRPTDTKPEWHICGPLDTSYSLAIVNGALRSGLNALINPQEPAPKLRTLLINDFPLRLQALPLAPLKLLANYAWEESGFPQAWVREINAQLHGLTVCSPWVKQILRSAGVKRPIAVVGNGADHLIGDLGNAELKSDIGPTHHFRFLHVSSGLPRKGLDLLVTAYAKAFNGADPVTLVIKTQPNEENYLAEQIQALQTRFQNPPLICVIWEDLSRMEMAALYQNCQAFVLTPRAEGFGLPIAEAAHYGLASIVSDFGGHRAFANPENALLVRSRFQTAQSHLGPHIAEGLEIFDSTWVEPDVNDLAEKLQIMRSLPEDSRKKIAQRMLVELEQYTWAKVARRTQATVAWLIQNSNIPKPPKVAWISSYNCRCGIATYSQNLVEHWPGVPPLILASENLDLVKADDSNVLRCWQAGGFDSAKITDLITARQCDVALIQHNPGLFATHDLSELLNLLESRKIPRYVTLHSTVDTFKDPKVVASIRKSLKSATRVLVHSVADLNLLKQHEIVDNVTLFPHGVYQPALAINSDWAKKFLDQRLTIEPNDFVLASFGFLLPHKGIEQLIVAASVLKQNNRPIKLLLLNALYPSQESANLAQEIQRLIASLELTDQVVFLNDFLDEEKAIALLNQANAVIYPYQHSDESASGAVRMAIAAHRPVLVTPLAIFNDLKDQVIQLPGISAHQIAEGLSLVLDQPSLLSQYAQASVRYSGTHQWESLSERLHNIVQGDMNDPFPNALFDQ